MFVPSDAAFEVRRALSIQVVLDYLDPDSVALTLEGEIVHCVPRELAANGATPGVAVQFEANASTLRAQFEELLGHVVVVPTTEDCEGTLRQRAKRDAVRVPVRIMPTMSSPFEATSRDLSSSGILVTVRDDVLPKGEIVRVCLWHPSGAPSVELDGKVVRQIKNKNGRIAAVAIAFDKHQAADPTTNDVLEALRASGHRSRLGGITGSLADLGLANMLQMFGSSAPQGTLVVEHEAEQGWVAFAGGHLLGAELGGLSGMDALVGMLSWGDGQFHFEASADPNLVAAAKPWPIDGAVLTAVCRLDEENRDAESGGENRFASGDEGEGPAGFESIPINPSTTFEVDFEQEELSRAALDKTEDAILDLAKAGMSVARLFAVIPEPQEKIQAALEGLVEMGVLVPR